MPDEDATPVIFFIVSVYAFGVVLLYALARAWEQSLSTRPRRSAAAKTQMEGRAVGAGNPSETVAAKVRGEDVRSG